MPAALHCWNCGVAFAAPDGGCRWCKPSKAERASLARALYIAWCAAWCSAEQAAARWDAMEGAAAFGRRPFEHMADVAIKHLGTPPRTMAERSREAE